MNLDVISNKSEALMRYLMIHLLSDKLPLYIVNEYPKSGGTWLGQMLSKAIDVPFPRNCFPELKTSIMHCHFANSWGMKNVVIIWRDPRDMLVSWYFHCLFKHNRGNAFLVDAVTSKLQFSDPENTHKNLPHFIEYCFTEQFYPRFTWLDFFQEWYDKPDVAYTKYELLQQDAKGEIQKIVKQLTNQVVSDEKAQEIVDYYSFKNQTGRTSGQQNNNQFLRKGIVGDWKNHFTPEAVDVFNRFAGKELILLGYAQDQNWGEEINS